MLSPPPPRSRKTPLGRRDEPCLDDVLVESVDQMDTDAEARARSKEQLSDPEGRRGPDAK